MYRKRRKERNVNKRLPCLFLFDFFTYSSASSIYFAAHLPFLYSPRKYTVTSHINLLLLFCRFGVVLSFSVYFRTYHFDYVCSHIFFFSV